MARDFSSISSEVMARLRLPADDAGVVALANGWINDAIQDVHGRYDWQHSLERQVIQTVADKTAGTVSVSASGTAVTGSSTSFASTDVGSFIQFQDSNDWYKITAYTSSTSIEIEIGYNGTSALSAATYTIRKFFYTISGAEKIVSAKQAQIPGAITCLSYNDFSTYLAFAESTGKATLFCVYGQSGNDLKVHFYPYADAAYNIEVEYKMPATLDSVATIPAKWLNVYIDGALLRGLEYVAIGNNELAATSIIRDKKGDFERGIARMIAEAEPESSNSPILQNRDVPNLVPGWHLPTGLSIPQD